MKRLERSWPPASSNHGKSLLAMETHDAYCIDNSERENAANNSIVNSSRESESENQSVYSIDSISTVTVDSENSSTDDDDDNNDLFFHGGRRLTSKYQFDEVSGHRSRRPTRRICNACEAVWNAASNNGASFPACFKTLNTADPEVLQRYAKNVALRSSLSYNPAALLRWKLLQSKVCYNTRPFHELSVVGSTSYAQLVSIFELNWGFVEPLIVCATSYHPSVSDQHSNYTPVTSGGPLCACSTVATEKESLEQSVSPRRFFPQMPARKQSSAPVLSLKNLPLSSTPPANSREQQISCSDMACIFFSPVADRKFCSCETSVFKALLVNPDV